jgi:hypothetical protein
VYLNFLQDISHPNGLVAPFFRRKGTTKPHSDEPLYSACLYQKVAKLQLSIRADHFVSAEILGSWSSVAMLLSFSPNSISSDAILHYAPAEFSFAFIAVMRIRSQQA